MIHDQADAPAFIHSAAGRVTGFLRVSEGKCCFASDIRDRFEQELPFLEMLLIQNNSISVPYFDFVE